MKPLGKLVFEDSHYDFQVIWCLKGNGFNPTLIGVEFYFFFLFNILNMKLRKMNSNYLNIWEFKVGIILKRSTIWTGGGIFYQVEFELGEVDNLHLKIEKLVMWIDC